MVRSSKRTQSQVKILVTGGSGLLATNWALAARAEHTVVLGLHKRKVLIVGFQFQNQCRNITHQDLALVQPEYNGVLCTGRKRPIRG